MSLRHAKLALALGRATCSASAGRPMSLLNDVAKGNGIYRLGHRCRNDRPSLRRLALANAGLGALPVFLRRRSDRLGDESPAYLRRQRHPVGELRLRFDRHRRARSRATLAMGCLGMLVQCVFHAQKGPRLIQVQFSGASAACSITASGWMFHSRVYFGTCIMPVAAVIGFTGGKSVGSDSTANSASASAPSEFT